VGPGRAFEQMLVISHTPDVELFPGRIEVSVAPDGARAITVTGG
jgi:hypothetical protein